MDQAECIILIHHDPPDNRRMAARTDPPTPEPPARFAPEGRPVALVTGASSGLGRENWPAAWSSTAA